MAIVPDEAGDPYDPDDPVTLVEDNQRLATIYNPTTDIPGRYRLKSVNENVIVW